MDIKDHEQFVDGVKSMKAFEEMFKKMSKELEHLRAFIVQQENNAISLEKQNKKAEADLAEIKRKMSESRLMSDANTKNVQDRLDTRHRELVEREAKVRILEEAANQQIAKANALLAAAESAAPKRRQTAAA